MTGTCEFLQNILAQMYSDSAEDEEEFMKKLKFLDLLANPPGSESEENSSLPADRFVPSKENEEDTSLDYIERVIIALCEFWALLGGVIGMALRGILFNKTLIYASDNRNVRAWIKHRDSNIPLVRFLLLILAAVESSYSFRVFCEYLRTYHNEAADAFTRKAIKDLLVKYGLTLLPEPDWTPFFHRGWAHRALTWVGQDLLDEQVALQLSVRRAPPGPAAPLSAVLEFSHGHFFVVREHLANGGLAFLLPS